MAATQNNGAHLSRDTAVANLKALMLWGIFLEHAFCTVAVVPQAPVVSGINWVAGRISVWVLGAFFMISGYYTQMSPFDRRGYVNLLEKRFFSLLIPFFTWNAIYIAAFLVSAKFMPAMQQKVAELKLNTWGGIADGFFGVTHHPADGPLWYIRSIFCFIVLYPLLRIGCRGKYGWLCPVGIAAVLAYFQPRMPLSVHEHLKPYMLSAFCFGIWFRENKISLHCFESGWPAYAAMALTAVMIAGTFAGVSLCTELAERRLDYLFYVPGTLFLLRFLRFGTGSRYDRFFVEPVFFVYAAHALAGTALLRIVGSRISPTSYYLLLLGGLFFFGGGMIVYAGYFALKRFMPVVLDILTGRIHRSGKNGE
ncbi:MAG: acyltransferase [Victivallaceae bacterium]|nr:acyltransferase [Victivallaceae bacterium]